MRISRAKVAGTLALLSSLLFAASGAAEDKPKVIRFSNPGVGVGARPISSGNAIATAHLRGLFEEEFKKDGIAIQWNFLRGAGPAVNELFANGLTDFASLGDLPSVIGRASGLKVRVLAGSSSGSNLYVSVPSDSPARTLSDLRGKRIAVNKGTATHLMGLKVLEKHGLSDKDVKLVNMDTPAAQLAIVSGDIDATLGGTDYLRLRDQGASRIIYSTREDNADELTSNSSFVASEDFITKYPEITKRVLKVLVKSAKYLAETNPTQVFQLWTKSGTTFSSFREDLQGVDLKYRTSPLIDDYHKARYKRQIDEAKRLGLIKKPFTYEQWVEPKFLSLALKELDAEGFWKPRDANGKLLVPDPTRTPAKPPAPPAGQQTVAPKPAANVAGS